MASEVDTKRGLTFGRTCALFFGIAIVVACLATLLTTRTGELLVYTKAASRMWDGAEIYRFGERKSFTYPPFFALVFVPLAGAPITLLRVFWYFLNFSLLGTGVWLVLRQVRDVVEQDPRLKGWFFALLALITARFMVSPFEYQSHDSIIFLLVTLTILPQRGRDWISGCCAGVATACKATPLLFLPMFGWQRRWLACVAVVVSLVATSFLPDLLLPRRAGGSWAVNWYQVYVSRVEVGAAADAEGAWQAWNVLNQSLAGTIYRLSHPAPMRNSSHRHVHLWHLDDQGIKLLTLSSQLMVLGLLCWSTWPRGTQAEQQIDEHMRRLGETAMVTTAMLLLSPMSSKQHFCTLFLPVTYCLVDYLYCSRDRWTGGILLCVLLLGPLGIKDLVGRPFADPQLAYGTLTACAVLCLISTARVLGIRRRANAKLGVSITPPAAAVAKIAANKLAA